MKRLAVVGFVDCDPIGFAAGDTNLYRFVGNDPINGLDPSGLSEAGRHHAYPVMLGGAEDQPLFQFDKTQHTNAEAVFKKYGVHNHNHIKGNDAARAAWAAMPETKQRAIIEESLKAAGVHDSIIKGEIDAIMKGATPGKYVPAIKRCGTGKNRLISNAAIQEAARMAKLASALGGVLIMGGVSYANDKYVEAGETSGYLLANRTALMTQLRIVNNSVGLPQNPFIMPWRDGHVIVRQELLGGTMWTTAYHIELRDDGTYKNSEPIIPAGKLPRDRCGCP